MVLLAAALGASCGTRQARAFPRASAFGHLVAQCELGPRNPGSTGHAACAEYIRATLEACGGRVSLQRFLHTAPGLREPVELTNIIARFGPLREGGLLLGAHWDTRPWADMAPEPSRRDEPILGANDGASGVALLLALAEGFREAPPEIPILLVFFDGEDLGRAGHAEEYLAGSRYFAEYFPGPFPQAGVVVDMVASKTMVLTLEERSRQWFPEMATYVDQVALRLGLMSFAGGWGPMVHDDHVPLIEAGIPTLLLIDFRDPFWHTHGDVPANCSEVSLAESRRLVEELVRGGFFR